MEKQTEKKMTREIKLDYAVGNKKGPVMYAGTVFKSQKQLNNSLAVAIIIAGIIPISFGLIGVSIILWIIAIFILCANNINVKEKKK